MPLSIWLVVLIAITSAGVVVVVAWRFNINARRNLDEQLTRTWQQAVRQLKHDAEQNGKQRDHEVEQLTKQLDHDAEQSERERRHSLLREVLLEAAAALLNLHSLLTRAADLACDEEALWLSFSENHARVVKVHMVAGEPTVDAVMMYMNELAPAFVELITGRRRIQAMPRLGRSAKGGDVTPEASARAELRRRSISLTIQGAQLLSASLVAMRGEMGRPLDQRRYDQLWHVQFGKMEPFWKNDIEDLGAGSTTNPST